MIRVFQPATADEHRAFLASHCDLCIRHTGCDILEAVTVNADTDPDYPDEWVRDDMGLPACTAFARQDGASMPAPEALAAEPEPLAARAADVQVVETRIVGRGVIDACRLAGKRALSVPYADVASLFGSEAEAMRDAMQVPVPARARVHRGKADVTITAKSVRDGASVTASVRLRVRRSA